MDKESYLIDKNFIQESPDSIGDSIKNKIMSAELSEWQIQPVMEKVRKGRIKEAVGELNGLIDLSETEKKHFSKITREAVLEWFEKEDKAVEEELAV